jgi:hypothetical protein
MVATSYRAVQQFSFDQVGPPIGPLDFHSGTAELLIGGLLYSPAVRTVLRYHGEDLIKVLPSEVPGEPGTISAVFTDDNGDEVLRLEENEWVGSTGAWDIEVTGQRLLTRRSTGAIALQLRLDPPGRIVVEHLDMRVRDCHVLVTERIYAVGRYTSDTSINWVHAHILIRRSSPCGAAIEFTNPSELEDRDLAFRGTGAELATQDRRIVLNANAGVLVKPLGIAIASLSGSFDLVELAVGNASLDDVRRVLAEHPDQLCRFISTGRLET